ncbi:DNA polymerase III subunit alpha [Thiothrix winogradskyi]|uniref:DNA polymerase III subunit alpha n=1 Tax=Thiothrix winogradskyi TaxID=96472 RepID=A0ABY3SX18_9GAMM|nr:DNA polymerase III subunit alpha [Thiothrix winogradskyi]UJS23968.1 DNA polymerase III subunit alpha [Thiothrix winogradskyi]
MTPFVHLRLHTEYSLVDSTIRIKPLMKVAASKDLPALAITDQNNFFGLVKFYKAAMGAGIKPIFGLDLLLADEQGTDTLFHTILLCQNNTGYRNLTKLVSRAYQQGQVLGVPRVQREWIKEFSDGVIMLSGGREGDIGQALLSGNQELADKRLQEWLETFPDRYYLELQRTGRDGEEDYIHAAIDLALAHDIPVVATNDVRFTAESDFASHEARVCIRDGYVLADPKRPKRYSPQQYLRTGDEMEELFADIPSAISNTVEIAKRCNVSLTLGKNYLPQFPIPDGLTEAQYFCQVSEKGLEERLDFLLGERFPRGTPAFIEKRKVYDERLKIELDVINEMGFPGYFLIVADFIQWAKDNAIPVGPGRGSGAGSLVAYALKITDLDPLAYDLLFERFLNPERVSMPDFDIDFCMDGRDKVIDYVARTYGRNQVSQIITYGSMAAKAVVRDVGRVLGHPYGFVDRIAKLIPFTIGITLEDALGRTPKSEKDSELVSPDLIDLYNKDEEVKSLMDLAISLEGLSRNTGKHAGGVLISPTDLTDFTAICCEENGEGVVSQFDKNDVEDIGLVKFDFLGLRNLTIIDWALQTINRKQAAKGLPSVDINRIPLDDKASFDLLKAQKTTAVFQLESRGMKDLIRRLQPDVFEDVVALVALFRPGPLQSGMVDDFINRKKGIAKVEYPHPSLEQILKPTYGVIVYQEQVMQIAQVLAQYTLGGADMLRRAMGKKKPEEMAKQRSIFMEGARNNNVDENQAGYIFDLMEKFAEYGFNKSHSAAYALVAFQTAWLKAHHPAAFMAAVMSADMDNTEKVVTLLDDCRQLSLQVLPPDINRSEYQFTVDDQNRIIYGLGAVKGAGEAALSVLVEQRNKEGAFKSLAELCKRAGTQKVNRRVLETLIKSGAFDSLGGTRRAMLEYLPEAMRMAEQYNRNQGTGQTDLFGGLFGGGVAESTPEATMPEREEFPEKERLRLEKETLGLYLTGHPLDEYQSEIAGLGSRKKLVDIAEDDSTKYRREPVMLAGLVASVRTQHTDNGKRAFVQLDDNTAYYEVMIFTDTFTQYGNLLEKEACIVLEGTLDTDQRTGKTRLRVEKVHNMQSVRENFLRKLVLRLEEKQVEQGILPALRQRLKPAATAGSFPITLEYRNAKACADLRLAGSWTVPLDDAGVRDLRQLLGKENVSLVF